MFTSLEEANAYIAANAANERKLSLKVGEKGGISLYGLNAQFPVTLYAQQWEKLITFIPEIQAFMKVHARELTTKDGSPFVPNGANANAGSTRNGPVTTRKPAS